MKEKKERLLRLWKIRQEQEGVDVSSVKTLEEAEHFYDKPVKKTAEKKVTKKKEKFAVTEEEDGNVHVRPVVEDEIIDTPVEEIVMPEIPTVEETKENTPVVGE